MKIVFFKTGFCYYTLKIFGLCPFTFDYEGNPEFSYMGLAINLFLSITCFFILIDSYMERLSLLLPNETSIFVFTQLIVFTGRAFSIISSLLSIGFCQKKILDFYSTLKIIDAKITEGELVKRRSAELNSKLFCQLGYQLTINIISYLFICYVDHSRFSICNIVPWNQSFLWFLHQSIYVVQLSSNYIYIKILNHIRNSFDDLIVLLYKHISHWVECKGIYFYAHELYPKNLKFFSS